MGSPWDVAFGRLAVQHGLVAQEAVRVAYLQLPPGRTLKDELVARRLLAPDRAHALEAMLRASAASEGDAATRLRPAPRADDSATMLRPAPAPRADDSATMLRPAPAPRADDSATMLRPGGPAPGATPARATRLPEVGAVVADRYELTGLLGKGGMGAVFRARDARTGELHALKVLLPGSDPDGAVLARFRREAEAVAKVDAHAGIVRVRTLGEHEGLPYVVMDLVEGVDLHALVKDGGPLDVARALRYTEAVARAVQHCHDKGVLHRDLKPANVLLRAHDDAPLVMDFGLALHADGERLTKTGEVMGTPAFMSPEQADGNKAEIDHRTDVYALGGVLYELVKGRPPFEGQPIQILAKVFRELPEPVALTRPDVPADLDVIVRKAMAKDKRLRYATAGDLADDVGRLARGEPITARAPTYLQELRWRWRTGDRGLVRRIVVAAVLLIAVTAALVVGSWQVRRRLMKELAGVLAEVRASLAEDPWPFVPEGQDESALRDKANEALRLAAQLDGNDDPTLSASALLTLRDLLAAGDGWGDALREQLDDPAAHGLALWRLARRLAVDGHDEGPTCARAAEHACWTPALGAPAGLDGPEERLVATLRGLGWGRDEAASLTLAQALEGRHALEALQAGGGGAGAAAGAVLARMTRLEDDVRRLLRQGRDQFMKALEGRLDRQASGDTVPYPSGWKDAKDLAGGPLSAWLAPVREVARREEDTAVVPAVVDLFSETPGGVDWASARTYETLTNLFKVLQQFAGDESLRRDQARALIFDVGARANAAKVDARAFAKLVVQVAPLITSLDPIELDGRLLTHHGAASCLVHGAFSLVSVEPSEDLLVALQRLGFSMPISRLQNAQGWLDRMPDLARRFPLGETYLTWFKLRETLRPRGRGDGAGRLSRRSPETTRELLELLATALGDRLDPATREALGVTIRATVPPILSTWEPGAMGELARLRLRLEASEPAPSRPVVDACQALIERLRGREAEFKASEFADFVKDAAQATTDVRIKVAELGDDPRWLSELLARERALWEESVEAAWRAAERAAAPAAPLAPEIEGQVAAMQELTFDADHLLAMTLTDALHGHGRVVSPAESAARHEELERRIRERLRLDPPLELLDDRRRLEQELGRLERAQEIAWGLVERVDRQLPTIVDSEDCKDARRYRNASRAFLADRALAAGEVQAARDLYEAARASGDLTEDETSANWWTSLLPRLQQP